MHRLWAWAACLVLGVFACGCAEEEPVGAQPEGPVDRELCGLWETRDDNGAARLLLLPWTTNEYLVQSLPAADAAACMRGWTVQVCGRPCLQLEWIGETNGTVHDERARYLLAAVQRAGRALEVRILNHARVRETRGKEESLRGAVERLCEDPALWGAPVVYLPVTP